MIENRMDFYGDNPGKRFGHTITMITDTKAVLFGGALGENHFKITNDTFLLDCTLQKWTKVTPLNEGDAPCPRAAHSAAVVENKQLVIFGGSESNGTLVDSELYLLNYKGNDILKWTKVPVVGELPPSRYGHTSIFFQHYILIIGGNIGSEPCNDVWSMHIKNPPFSWVQINFKDSKPNPRVYHSIAIWRAPKKSEMVLIFGGRGQNNMPLNDLWGLRKHSDGQWDWTKAQYSNKGIIPEERYLHSMASFGNTIFVVGGRNNNQFNDLNIDIFNLEVSTWVSAKKIDRFRHVNWIFDKKIFVHGGFKPNNPNTPLDTTAYYNLLDLYSVSPIFNKIIEEIKSNSFNNNIYNIKSDIEVFHWDCDEAEDVQIIDFNLLTKEGTKLTNNQLKKTELQEKIDNIYNYIMGNLYKIPDLLSYDYYNFQINKNVIINLCNAMINLLKGEKPIIKLRPSIKIFGSIHGQYHDLMRLFHTHGAPETDKKFKTDIDGIDYLFLGNYVDKGKYSLEVICILFALKIKKPKLIHLLRGSHEESSINLKEGLGFECAKRLNDNIDSPDSIFNKINEVFEYLPFCAILDNKIFCVSSGIVDNLGSIAEINKIQLPFKIDYKSQHISHRIVIDMLWSDPVTNEKEKANKINENRTNLGKIRFGTERIRKFLADNNFEIIIRGHESVMEGFEKFGDTNLYTIFSCSNYGGVFNNKAACLIYTRRNAIKPKQIEPENTINSSLLWNSNVYNNNKGNNMVIENEEYKNRSLTPPRNYLKNKL